VHLFESLDFSEFWSGLSGLSLVNSVTGDACLVEFLNIDRTLSLGFSFDKNTLLDDLLNVLRLSKSLVSCECRSRLSGLSLVSDDADLLKFLDTDRTLSIGLSFDKNNSLEDLLNAMRDAQLELLGFPLDCVLGDLPLSGEGARVGKNSWDGGVMDLKLINRLVSLFLFTASIMAAFFGVNIMVDMAVDFE